MVSFEVRCLVFILLGLSVTCMFYSTICKTCFYWSSLLYSFILVSVVQRSDSFFHRSCSTKSVLQDNSHDFLCPAVSCCSCSIVHQRFICQESCDLGFLQYNLHLLIRIFSFARLQFHSIIVCITLELDYECSSVNQFELTCLKGIVASAKQEERMSCIFIKWWSECTFSFNLFNLLM